MKQIETCVPKELPIHNLKWEELILPIAEAREALARFDERLKKKSSPRLEMKEALEFASRWAKTKPLNIQFFCKIHEIVKKDAVNPKEIGKLRTRQNWIGKHGCKIEEATYFPPEPKIIRKAMQNLIRYIRAKKIEPLVQLAIIFAQILIIHPFMDGNGRVARIFIPIWLWKKGLISKPALFMGDYFEKNRPQYFRKLFQISNEDAWNEWIQYFLKGVIEQASHSQRK